MTVLTCASLLPPVFAIISPIAFIAASLTTGGDGSVVAGRASTFDAAAQLTKADRELPQGSDGSRETALDCGRGVSRRAATLS